MNARRKMRRGRSDGRMPRGQLLTALLRVAAAIAVIALSQWSNSHAFAQKARGSAELEAKLDSRGTLMLRNATLADWAFAIKQEWGINIVSGANLEKETVDAGFEDTPLRDILSEILFVRGYGFQAVGNSLRILRLEDLGAMRPGFETSILPLDLLQPSEVEPSVKLLMSPGATVQAVPSSRSLIVIDTAEQIKKIKAHIEVLELNARKHAERRGDGEGLTGDAAVDLQMSRQRVEVFPIQFLKAEDLVTTIETIAPDARIGIIAEENRLVVSAPKQQLEDIAELLKRLDIARQQVRITALLYDVDLEVLEQFGFNWSHAGKGRLNAVGDPNSLFSLSSDSFTAAPSSSPLPGSAIVADTAATAASGGALGGMATLTNLSRHFDISAVIRALDSTDGSRLLARPNIVAYDRVQAEFQSVSEIPVQELTQTEAGGNIGTTSFREAGIKLTVTPQIMHDGTIVMNVMPEFSVLAGFQSGQPIIDKRSATTTVQIVNGQTTVIGGLLRRNEFEKQSGLPHLARMKYFGVFFRDHDTTIKESELLVFIKAEIIPVGQANPPRDEAAQLVANDLLDQVPYASHGPIMPYCGDPYCPYHHPRPWGSALPPSACSACADGKHGGAEQSDYYAPGISGGEAVPTPPQPGLPSVNSVLPPASVDGNDSVPPVVVDEARRRWNTQQRAAMRRLPPVSVGAGTRTATRQTPELPSRRAQPVAPPRTGVRTATAPVNRPTSPTPSVGNASRQSNEQPRQALKAPWWKKLF